MPKYWKISNRSLKDGVPSGGAIGPMTFWVADNGPLDNPASWTKVTAANFKKLLAAAADQFPALPHGMHEDQHHITFVVHGYNNGWQDAARLYTSVSQNLFEGPKGLGLAISLDWPSQGSVLGYYPDRDTARAVARDFAVIFDELHKWLIVKQQDAVTDPAKACKAKLSVIAHSMGNYVMQRVLSTVWTRNNQPLLASLLNQFLMVAADVDNDLFEPGADDGTDGNAISNLTYRVTSLYSGRDAVLGTSAGLKHFGARRLGRSGLAKRPPTGKDNIWDVDCSTFFPPSVNGLEIHGEYFRNDGTYKLMRELLRGLDRSVLEHLKLTQGTAWPA